MSRTSSPPVTTSGMNRTGVEPDLLADFLAHRMSTLETLARKEHWMGIASLDAEGLHDVIF